MLCLIRSLAQILCDDLARAEKAKDGKKMEKYTTSSAYGCLYYFSYFCGLIVSGDQSSWARSERYVATRKTEYHTLQLVHVTRCVVSRRP